MLTSIGQSIHLHKIPVNITDQFGNQSKGYYSNVLAFTRQQAIHCIEYGIKSKNNGVGIL